VKNHNSYATYQPSDQRLREADHWEVWDKLPPELKFEAVAARDPSLTALCARDKGVYVWVFPHAVPSVQSGIGPFMALGSRRGKDRMDFIVTTPSADDPIAFAKAENARKLRELSKGAKGPKNHQK